MATHCHAARLRKAETDARTSKSAPTQRPSRPLCARRLPERWVRLFPVRIDGVIDPEACRLRQQALGGNAERIAELRQRLERVRKRVDSYISKGYRLVSHA
jgi:hypothetical protein